MYPWLNATFKEQIDVEKKLYDNPPVFEYIDIQDKGFLVSLFGIYPKLRPLHLDSFVLFCVPYLKDDTFRNKVLEQVFTVSPTLIQRLHRIKSFSMDEIKSALEFHKKKFLYLFFKDTIELDYSGFSDDRNSQNYWNEKELDFLIQFGFHKSSMEFCLKYDQFEEIDKLLMKNPNLKTCRWNPFEWSEEPKSLDLLSFCSFYGSLKCFKVLLKTVLDINEHVARGIVCSGSKELFNYISNFNFECFSFIHEASRFAHIRVIEYLINHKADINGKNESTTIAHLTKLLFIWQH